MYSLGVFCNTEQNDASEACTADLLLLYCMSPLPLPPHMFQCVGSVFVWRCFDRQGLCVWAVLAGWPACLVQS